MRIIAVAFAFIGVVACSAKTPASRQTENPTPATTAPQTTMSIATPTPGVPCSTMFRPGRPTKDVIAEYDAEPCESEPNNVFVSGIVDFDCDDGSKVYYVTDYGWGREDGMWHAYHGSEDAPARDEACRK